MRGEYKVELNSYNDNSTDSSHCRIKLCGSINISGFPWSFFKTIQIFYMKLRPKELSRKILNVLTWIEMILQFYVEFNFCENSKDIYTTPKSQHTVPSLHTHISEICNFLMCKINTDYWWLDLSYICQTPNFSVSFTAFLYVSHIIIFFYLCTYTCKQLLHVHIISCKTTDGLANTVPFLQI